MPLTSQQLATLKADILANPPLSSQPNSGDGNRAIADYYNTATSHIVWRSSVSVDAMLDVFVWTEIDALAAGKARIWQWMSQLGVLRPSKPAIRQGLSDAFSAGAPNTLTAITVLFKRAATAAEKLFATGTGTNISPATMAFEGLITHDDVEQARAS